MINRNKVIKDVIGQALKDMGFAYKGKEFGVIWTFSRTVGSVEQCISIQQESRVQKEYMLMIYTSARGHDIVEIGKVLPEYKNKRNWEAETDEEFVKVIEFFASFLKEKAPAILEEMLTDKGPAWEDPFETPERKQYFKEHRKELVEKYDAIYHILSIESADDKLKRIDEVLWDKREAEITPDNEEEMYDLFMGLAAILSEIMLVYDGAEIDYDKPHVELTVPDCAAVYPLYDIASSWKNYRVYNDKSMLYIWGGCRMVPIICELKKQVKKKRKKF